jgi:hypothetical protein
MKYINLLLILLVLVSCSRDSEIPCIPAQLSDHVIAFYPFSNQSLNDFSGNNHSLNNSDNSLAVKDRNGNENCAFRFNGTKSQHLYRDGSFLNGVKSKSFSISLWYQPLDGKNNHQFLFIKGESGENSCDLQWYLSLIDCERISFYINKQARYEDFPPLWQDTTIKDEDKCMEEINLYNQKWHHIVITYKKGVMNIYRNGLRSKRDTQIRNCGAITEDWGNIYLGKDYFGDIDDVIIFDKALSQSEVNKLYNMDTCCM